MEKEEDKLLLSSSCSEPSWRSVYSDSLVFAVSSHRGITKGFDNKFGDQHLKTAVALIELYKVRYGRYPDSLHELKFLGDWDQIVLYTVAYYPSADRKSYYVEVTRGWMGKPDLTEPDEFWRGTGFSAALKPKDR